MAVEDFGGSVLGKPIDLLVADHQNKVDVGLAIAREWYDERGVRAIFDITNSGVGLAVQDLARASVASAEVSHKSITTRRTTSGELLKHRNGYRWSSPHPSTVNRHEYFA